MHPAGDDLSTEAGIINASNGSSNLSSSDGDVDHAGRNDDFWIIMEGFLFFVIVLGNILTIVAIAWSRRLRTVISNYFILSLAVSDVVVGVALPYHLTFYVDPTLNHNEFVCISRFVLVNIGCTGSINNLMVVALDRYVAIVHPLSYNVHATHKHVLLIIVITWIFTLGVSSVPIYWNYFDASQTCEIETVLSRYYISGIQMPIFALSLIIMIVLYWKIWKEAHMHRRRMNRNVVSSTAETNDRKSIQMVLLILGCFSICWLPYAVCASLRIFGFWKNQIFITCYRSAYILAMANSGMNPFIYAWKNTNFRRAFQRILHMKSPNSDMNSSFKIYLEKQQELKRQQTNVKKDSRVNENSNSCSSNQQTNHGEEIIISSTAL